MTAAEEAVLTAALSAAPAATQASSPRPPPPPPTTTTSTAQAKLDAARAAAAAYKKSKSEGGYPASVKPIVVEAKPAPAPHPPPLPSGALFDRSTAPPASTPSRGPQEDGGEGGASSSSSIDARLIGANSGSADVAAGFLRGLMDTAPSADDAALRPEEFTAKRVAAERARGAEIITAAPRRRDDDDENDATTTTSPAYKPTVATWGVFPRPDNISRAYGGGRTLRPGQALESEDDAAARKARQQAALKEYRKLAGLDIDPADEASAKVALDEGTQLLNAGTLEAAASKFADAATLMPPRTLIGGLARMNQGICLDSLGRTEEAFALYKSVQSHPNATVAKPVSRLMFGRKASDFLKADTINYRVTAEEAAPFFAKLRGDYDNTYVAGVGENAARSIDVAVAIAVVGVPLLLAAALLVGR